MAWCGTSTSHDGYRLIVRRDGDTVRLFTRRGHDWDRALSGGRRSSRQAAGQVVKTRRINGLLQPLHLVFDSKLKRTRSCKLSDS